MFIDKIKVVFNATGLLFPVRRRENYFRLLVSAPNDTRRMNRLNDHVDTTDSGALQEKYRAFESKNDSLASWSSMIGMERVARGRYLDP